MKIAQSAVSMLSMHELQTWESRSEKLEARVATLPGGRPTQPVDKVTLMSGMGIDRPLCPDKTNDADGLDGSYTAVDRAYMKIKILFEALLGIKIHWLNPKTQSGHACNTVQGNAPKSDTVKSDTSNSAPAKGAEFRYEETNERSETEQTAVAISGTVKTSDGKDISFELNLQMSRSFSEATSTSLIPGEAQKVDPIVVNFDGAATSLTDWTFDFDLNSDGTKEKIPFVNGGSGILVFDKDSNGQVDNGQELFGPSTGDGFAELASLDEDKNNWIDENDAAFNQLKVWQRDEAGNETLSALSQMNIGALYVTGVRSNFDLKNPLNVTQGQVTKTGVYLNENGGAGSLQQVDISV
ncbi:MAG: hypothetical protein CSYNP_02708 [Syntrophus sp. SKADARSKE-3]|nr:hypothetical protein [Syntrophus sp. SKADARSKE-3]